VLDDEARWTRLPVCLRRPRDRVHPASARELVAKGERRKRKGESPGHLGTPREVALWQQGHLIETFGCQMNVHDSERMAGSRAGGYEPAADAGEADVVVINTCSVRDRAEQQLYTRLRAQATAAETARPGRSGGRLRRAAGRRVDPPISPALRTSSSAPRPSGACRCSSRRRAPAPTASGSSTPTRTTTCRFR
jgi:hypothetical protein